ncbi:hypothetical protein CPB85DRAFT_1448747 [Mucidula mucida]|nr:hypothetical protein CPB85DRAFT_1448747 [Mucidula mucida]
MTTAPPSKSRKSTKAKTRRKLRKAQTGSHRETIRDILFTRFPRVHSNEEVLASQRTYDFGPPLTQLAPFGSKRSRRLTADVFDKAGHPLDNTLISWQGPMPGYHMMHLAKHLRREKIVFIGNLPSIFADSIARLGGLGVKIPQNGVFSYKTRGQELGAYEKTTGSVHAVETIQDLEKAQLYREKLIAACSSAAIASPMRFADSVGLLAWTGDPPTLQPGSEEASAIRLSAPILDPELPGVSNSTKRAHKLAYDAIEHFGLSAIQATRVQPICAPLNEAFPLSAAVRAAKLEIPLESFICQGPNDPAHFCRSSHCRGKVAKFPYPFTTAGRPTGVDGDPVLELIARAAKSNAPVEPPTKEELVTSSLLLDQAWGVLVGTDSTVGTITGVNEQMTVIRHRDSGTMILSDVQIVHRKPITSENPHLSVQIGQTAFAYYDALLRAVKLDEHMRRSTLPASFRYPYQNEIKLLQSNLDFEELSRAYQVSVGKFLPPAISDSEYTYERMLGLFQHAIEIHINWDDDDASMLHYIFGPFKSPMMLPVVRSAMNFTTANTPTSVLNVKIHYSVWKTLLVHNNLSRENILFEPSDPTCFYVVGWQKALPIEDAGVLEVLKCVEPEEEWLQGLLASKKHHVYDEGARHNSEVEDRTVRSSQSLTNMKTSSITNDT